MMMNIQNSQPLASCWIMGQLGNQLYQIATTLAYAWDHQALPVFPYLNKQEDRISYNRDRIFFRLDASLPPRPFLHVFEETKYYSSQKIPFHNDQIIVGYFQSWKHFDHHRDQIRSVFAPSRTVLDTIQSKYNDLLAFPNTVAVHVRTQNKRAHELKLHQFFGIEYFEQAMNQFPQDSLFVIFSDRIGWCKKHFPVLKKNIRFIEGNDGVVDLFLMSMMKNNIICNSSFSWWGAYLNQNPNKTVIAPQFFIDPRHDPNFPTKDFYLPDWKLLMPNFDLLYPEDISQYHQESVNG